MSKKTDFGPPYYKEMLPPVVAAWISNFLFVSLGFLILAYAE